LLVHSSIANGARFSELSLLPRPGGRNSTTCHLRQPAKEALPESGR
jgi:hypothetical protein